MLWNNIKIALRNMRKNKLYAIANIAGLAIGICIYVFGSLLVDYERNHDAFFKNSERIYTIGSTAGPGLDMGIESMNVTYSAVGPILENEATDVEFVARTIAEEFLMSAGAESFYEGVRFADPGLLEIFDLQYLHGDESALQDPTGVVLSEAAALKFFGRTDVMGEVITLDNEHDFRVAAVFADLPVYSHFNSLPILQIEFDFLLPIKALVKIRDWDEAGDYFDLSLGNMTYVLIPEEFDQEWLQAHLDGIYERFFTDSARETVGSIFASPITHANLSIWDTFAMPIVFIVQLLSTLVLVVACVNYTNLATAQALGRSREVGMRKTMGASQQQLLAQFLIESVLIAAMAMVVAIAILEAVIPLFNNAAGKAMQIDYLQTLPWLAMTAILVGTLAGLYPAWLITRASPIDALRDIARKGKKGSRMRGLMIGGQFAISAFMLALVGVVYVQNQKIEESSYVFPRSEIWGMSRLNVDTIQERLDTLRHAIEAVPGVDSVAWSSQVPYQQNNSTTKVAATPADEAGAFSIQLLRMSPEFLSTYDIELLAGRNLSRDIENDRLTREESEVVNVLVNELTLKELGITSPQDALDVRLYDIDEDDPLREMIIVGVVPTQNIVGMFNKDKPWMYMYNPDLFRVGSVRISGGNMLNTISDIEDAWERVIPEYPIQGRFLDDVFEDVYKILKFMNYSLAGFAFIALALALFGLFGLAAFMAAQRTKEIGVRKVLGASSSQIAWLLVMQLSRPVAWALAIALPLAYFASSLYLNLFTDRIGSTIPILLVSGAVAVVLAWGTVAGHAIRIARSNPVLALRYE